MKDIVFWVGNGKSVKATHMSVYCGSKLIADYDGSEYNLGTCQREARRKCVAAANANIGVKCVIEVACDDFRIRELYQTTASPLSARQKKMMIEAPFMFR